MNASSTEWGPNYTPNDFSGSIQLRNWGINTLKRKRLNTETETARSYSSKQNSFFLKMHKET